MQICVSSLIVLSFYRKWYNNPATLSLVLWASFCCGPHKCLQLCVLVPSCIVVDLGHSLHPSGEFKSGQ